MRSVLVTALPVLQAVTKGGAAGVMCSYNAINGVPTCASQQLNTLLRQASTTRGKTIWGGILLDSVRLATRAVMLAGRVFFSFVRQTRRTC